MAAKKLKKVPAKTPPRRGFFLSEFPKDLVGIRDLTRPQIEKVLATAERFKALISLHEIANERRSPSAVSDHASNVRWGAGGERDLTQLRGHTVINLFFEPSTRTRTSFEIAARRLSADLVTITPQTTSLAKGESLKDMVENLEAMGPDLLVVRHAASGVPGLIARHTEAAVINAGDGSHEHPSQALVDLFTVREKLGADALEGLHLVIVGDLAYSRVARSDIYAFKKMGARVTCIGPATLLPPGMEALGARLSTDLDREIPSADVLMLLRIQKERQEKLNFPSLSEYTRFFGLNKERFARMKKEAIIMHPGPINRGVEIDPDIADGLVPDGPKTVILNQVHNGIPVRMAILSLWSRGRS